MTSFHIKLLAIGLMLVDHIGLLFFPEVFALRIIGRLAFPLFAWQLAVSATHTKNPRRFMTRLLIGGLISQPIYSWFISLAGHDPWFGNIFFTLALGLSTILALRRYQLLWQRTVAITLALVVTLIIPIDYGLMGLLSIIAFYYTLARPRLMLITQVLIFWTCSAWLWWQNWSSGISITAASQPIAPLAVIIASLHNHQQGPKMTYLFYIFYPAHLLILGLLYVLVVQ